MAKIEFDYNPWDRKSDVALAHPGTPVGFAMVNGALFPGREQTRDADDRNPTVGPSIQGVIELLAGSLEWLREYGLSAKEVQGRVRAYMERNRGSEEQQLLRAGGRDIYGIADPDNLAGRLNKNLVPNWRS